MRRLLGAFTTGALLILASTASAVTIQTSDTTQPWQQWSDQAQVPTYAGTLPLTVAPDFFSCGGSDDASGCTSITGTIDANGNPGAPTVSTEIDGGATNYDGTPDPWTVRATLYHELGQVFWAEYMTPAAEAQFMSIVGLPGDSSDWGEWDNARVIDGVTITFAPYEWFAEGYRYCAEYGVNQPARVTDYDGLAYPGDKATFAAQQREVCQLIDQVGLDNGIATPPQATYPAAATPKHAVKATRPRKHGGRRIRLTWGRRRVW